jgi:hypothetical protein
MLRTFDGFAGAFRVAPIIGASIACGIGVVEALGVLL